MRRYDVQFVACHRMPSRSFFFRRRQFPVCARCTGILLGYLSFPAFFIGAISPSLWIGIALNVPALVDGASQAAGWRESNNALRLVTGVLSGVGQTSLLASAGTAFARVLVALFNGGLGVLS